MNPARLALSLLLLATVALPVHAQTPGDLPADPSAPTPEPTTEPTPEPTPEPSAPPPVVEAPVAEPAPSIMQPAVMPPAKKKPKYIAAIGLALPLYVWAKPVDGMPSISITPDERLQLAQTAQIGFFVHPRVAVHLVGIFLETLRTDAGKTGFGFGGVSVYATYRIYKGLNIGAGPMVWFRKYFENQGDVGAYYTFGYTWQFQKGYSLTYAVSSPQGYFDKPVAAFGTGFRFNKVF
jgi:hypothetical protein